MKYLNKNSQERSLKRYADKMMEIGYSAVRAGVVTVALAATTLPIYSCAGTPIRRETRENLRLNIVAGEHWNEYADKMLEGIDKTKGLEAERARTAEANAQAAEAHARREEAVTARFERVIEEQEQEEQKQQQIEEQKQEELRQWQNVPPAIPPVLPRPIGPISSTYQADLDRDDGSEFPWGGLAVTLLALGAIGYGARLYRGLRRGNTAAPVEALGD